MKTITKLWLSALAGFGVCTIIWGVLILTIPPEKEIVTVTKIKIDTVTVIDKTVVIKAFARGWNSGCNSVTEGINLQGGASYPTPLNNKIETDYQTDTALFNLLIRLGDYTFFDRTK
jgi:hypothetical protein